MDPIFYIMKMVLVYAEYSFFFGKPRYLLCTIVETNLLR